MSVEEKHSYAMSIAFGYVENKKKLISLAVKEHLVFGGYDGGFFIACEHDGEWKIMQEVELGYKVLEIEPAGMQMAIAKSENGKKVFNFWFPESQKMEEDMKIELKYFSTAKIFSSKFTGTHVFVIGGRGDADKTGVEIWNVETGNMVRHLLKGEKQYESINTNGEFLVICEYVCSWTSGREHNLKMAVYNVDQLINPDIPEEDLWNYTTEYSVMNMGGEHIRAVFNKNFLIVNHSQHLFSIKEIVKHDTTNIRFCGTE
jgi:hypothetical protein